MAIFLLQFPIGDPIPFYRPVYVESENWPTQAQIVYILEDLHKKILSMTGESYWEDIIEAVKKGTSFNPPQPLSEKLVGMFSRYSTFTLPLPETSEFGTLLTIREIAPIKLPTE